jgi:hypothetical protein
MKTIRKTLLIDQAFCLRNTESYTRRSMGIVTTQIVSPGLDMALLVGLMACSAMSMVYTMPPSKVETAGLCNKNP